MTERTYSAAHIYRRLLHQIRPYWPNIVGLLILSLLTIPLALLLPIPLKIVVDNVLGSEPMPGWFTKLLPGISNSTYALLGFAVLLVVLIALLSRLVDLGYRLLHINTSERMVLGFRSRLFGHAQRLSLSYHDREGSTDTAYRIFYDAPAIQYLATEGFIPFITATLTFFSMIFIITRLSWPLTLVALCISPILFILARAYRVRLRHQYRQVKRRESGSLSVVQEALSALRVVKAFGQEKREENRFKDHASGTMQVRLRLAIDEGTLNLLLGLTVATGTALVLFIGTRQVVSGVLSLGGLLLVMSYLSQLYSPLKTVSRKIASLQSHLASAERAFTLLDQESDVYERPDALPLKRAQGTIAFDNVSFGYEEEQTILSHISFEIEWGTRVGIVGQTGAGKSTMINLLARFYDPSQGRILLDGVDLQDYRVVDLRNQFSIVLQDTILFATTIRENIAYARSDANDEEIEVAARAANIHDFVISQPDGYDTIVGERGMRLSGGERQRIALARAFLKDAPILILDEPTSSVDMRTETSIMEAMERLMVGRTVFMVAHRLSTLRGCDLLLEIDNQGRSAIRTDVDQAIDQDLAPMRPTETLQLPVAWSDLALPKKDSTALEDHPAVQAWLAVQSSGSVPNQITPLKFKPKGIHKSATFRLEGIGHNEAGVIAKRCLTSTGRLEHTIYSDILPSARVTAPFLYGFLEESDGSYCWLLMESIDGQQYAPDISSHRILAAEWLAYLHTRTTQRGAALQLPAHDAARYLKHLKDARRRIISNMGNAALSEEDRVVLRNILNHLDFFETYWTHIEAATLMMPSTLVHGDLVGKNLRIREIGNEPHLVPFDWEMAGWGFAGVDLAWMSNQDSDAYLENVRHHWPAFDSQTFNFLTVAGQILRNIMAIEWVSQSLKFEWLVHSMRKMAIYDKRITKLIRFVFLEWDL